MCFHQLVELLAIIFEDFRLFVFSHFGHKSFAEDAMDLFLGGWRPILLLAGLCRCAIVIVVLAAPVCVSGGLGLPVAHEAFHKGPAGFESALGEE